MALGAFSGGIVMKKKYRFSAEVTISVWTEVEAESEEEARDIALGNPMMDLCGYCSQMQPDGLWVTNGDLDGEPQNVKLDS